MFDKWQRLPILIGSMFPENKYFIYYFNDYKIWHVTHGAIVK